MFNFSWSEIGVIVAVALVLIGPKDMPVAVRAVMGTIRKARRMAAEFQGHVDEMMREANLGEVRDTLNEFRNLNVADALERSIDPDGTLRDGFAADPQGEFAEAEPVGELGAETFDRSEDADPAPLSEPPPFIPPSPPATPTPPAAAIAPAFIPPPFIPPAGAAPR
ncbi:MAG: Sec-independent protein translocase protein TatB [Acetobacteraceae bacterium]